jgi:hypothetical protein
LKGFAQAIRMPTIMLQKLQDGHVVQVSSLLFLSLYLLPCCPHIFIYGSFTALPSPDPNPSAGIFFLVSPGTPDDKEAAGEPVLFGSDTTDVISQIRAAFKYLS